MPENQTYQIECDRLLQEQIANLHSLSFDEISSLPEAAEHELHITGHRCQLTVFVQPMVGGKLVVVQIARLAALGMLSYHRERGLVFGTDGSIRDASENELLITGG